jgi:chemotaxis signal transduction protein
MSVIATADIELEIEDLDAEVARRLLAQRAASLRREDAAAARGREVLVWTLGSEKFALPLGDIDLVLKSDRTTPVPGAPAALIGLASRRGRLLNVVDPAPALGQRTAEAGDGHLLVLKNTRPRLALRVDHAEGVTALTIDALDDAEAGGALTRQAPLADGGHLLLVDKDRLIEALGLAGQQRGM